MPIDLYYMPVSPTCRAVQLAAEAIGVELNLKLVDLIALDQMKPEYLKINPQHTVPTIDDNGFILYHSRAILGYLVNKYGRNDSLYPKDSKKRAVVDQRLFLDADLYHRFKAAYYGKIEAGQEVDPALKEKFNESMKWLDDILGKSKWVAGEQMSIADFAFVSSMSTIEICGIDFTPYKNLLRWYSDCKTTMKKYKEIDDVGAQDYHDMIKRIKAAAPAKSE